MFAVLGASGNTGRVVAEELLAQGEKVRVIGRDENRLASLVRRGADAFVAQVTDAAQLAKAFEGVQGVYAMIPPNMSAVDALGFQDRVIEAVASALEKAAVPYVVALSSIGADKPERTGPVLGVHRFEQKLSGISGLNAVFLRAGYFMENLLPQAQVIRGFGKAAGPLRADLQLPFIATRDIGARAAAMLRERNFTGKRAFELLGQRDLSYREAAAVIGKAIEKPDLEYVQLPREQFRPMMIQMGMSDSTADSLVEMADALNSGYMKALDARSAENTTPTSIEAFVVEKFVPVFTSNGANA